MKKFLTLIAVAAVTLTANAQKTVQGSRFVDNWSIGLVGGGVTPMKAHHFFLDTRGTYGVEVTKQITPVFGLGVQYTVSHNTTGSANVYDQQNLQLQSKFNLSNIFCGYNGKPRTFEAVLVLGAGWGHNYYTTAEGGDDNYFTSKGGVDFNFNLGQEKAWTISLKPAVVCANTYDYPSQSNISKFTFKKANAAVELMAGITYHFKNKSNGKHYMTFVRAYDQAEVDGLNAKINDLRGQLNDKEAEAARQNEAIRNLQEELNDCRNKKPVVETVTKTTNSLESVVTFRQGKTTVDAAQLPNVERVATYLKNHKNAKVSIKGYASPEGSAEINAKIANARAEAVKTILTNKYKIAASRISAEGQGVGSMFSEPDWNRVSICTINE